MVAFGTNRTGHQRFLSPCTYFWLHFRAAAFSSFISSTLSEILLLTALLKSRALRICGLQYLLLCSVLGPHILLSVSEQFIKTDKVLLSSLVEQGAQGTEKLPFSLKIVSTSPGRVRPTTQHWHTTKLLCFSTVTRNRCHSVGLCTTRS